MFRRSIALMVLGLAACSDSPGNPDAPSGTPDSPPGTPDAGPPADAPTVVDAPGLPDGHEAKDAPPAEDGDPSPDGAVDPTCAPDQLCLAATPIDGSTPPPGRLAVAWVQTTGTGLEVAFDEAWAAPPVTGINLVEIAAPSPPYHITDAPFCPGGRLAIAIAVASTDPDGDGSISSGELLNGFDDHTAYGIGQAIIAWTDVGCPAMPPDFPEGLSPGVHVYTIDEPVLRLDGTPVDFQTCAPGSAACENLNNPL
jgi:hypothetical protein